MTNTETVPTKPSWHATLPRPMFNNIMDTATGLIDAIADSGRTDEQSVSLRVEDMDEVQKMAHFDLLNLLDERGIITWYTSDRDTSRSMLVMRNPGTFRDEAMAAWTSHVGVGG